MAKLGDGLLMHRELPSVSHNALGHEMYLTRHESLAAMQEAIRLVQAPA